MMNSFYIDLMYVNLILCPIFWTKSFLTSSNQLLGGSAFQDSILLKLQQMAMQVIKLKQPIRHELEAG